MPSSPNGIFAENACNYAKNVIPKADIKQRKKMFIEASEYAAEHGITTVQSNDLGTIVFDYPEYFKFSIFDIIFEFFYCFKRYLMSVTNNSFSWIIDVFEEFKILWIIEYYCS